MNDKIKIFVESIAYGGNGIGRHDGKVCFVPGALPGETLSVIPTKIKKSHFFAEIFKIITPAPNRIKPTCPYAFDAEQPSAAYCPGCQYQNINYDDEIITKNKQYCDLLHRFANIKSDFLKSPIASPKNLEYRNKITLHSTVQNNKIKLGYYKTDNTNLIEINQCPLACQPINKKLNEITEDKNNLIHESAAITIRYTKNNGAIFWKSICNNSRLTPDHAESYDQLLLETTSYGDFYVPKISFFQINIYQRDTLITETLQILKENPTEYLFDLYCGVGVFGISAASRFKFKKIIASDIDPLAIKTAKTNAALHEVSNMEIFSSNASQIIAKGFNKLKSDKTTLIVDPPRTGLHKDVTNKLISIKPKQIIYISCSADTLCRDLKLFKEAGYKINHTRLIDMFPRTAHFESITLLSQL